MLLGRRISLGPIIPADFPSMFCWANDVDAARFDLAYRPVDFVQHTQWCESIGKDPSMVVFAIRKLDNPAIIGFVRIFSVNSVHQSAEFGIRIGEEGLRGQGFGKEATRIALSFCWNHLNLRRVQLIAFGHNERALRCYAASGFAREGLLREAVFIQGEWVDLIVMTAFRPAREARLNAPKNADSIPLAPAA